MTVMSAHKITVFHDSGEENYDDDVDDEKNDFGGSMGLPVEFDLINKSNRVRTTDAFWRTARVLVFETSLKRLLNGIVSCS